MLHMSFYFLLLLPTSIQDHGPLAITLVERLCGTDERGCEVAARWERAQSAVLEALGLRADVWDAALHELARDAGGGNKAAT